MIWLKNNPFGVKNHSKTIIPIQHYFVYCVSTQIIALKMFWQAWPSIREDNKFNQNQLTMEKGMHYTTMDSLHNQICKYKMFNQKLVYITTFTKLFFFGKNVILTDWTRYTIIIGSIQTIMTRWAGQCSIHSHRRTSCSF
jgi:hypothetical protein